MQANSTIDNPVAGHVAAPPSRALADPVANDWIKYGAWSGLIFSVLFMSVALVPMPDRLSTVIALVFPLFLLVGHVGLYHFLTRHRPAFTTQLAVILGIGAPVLVSAMITVQMSLVSYMERYYKPLDEALKAEQINIWRAVDSVQLGLDVAWDMFILPTIILFSLGIMRHPAFGRVFGGIGLFLGIGGLALNIWTFPTPPINVGLPDVGPFAVTWYGILFILMVRAYRKMA
ncbi:MAG: hypothetical protein ACSLE2_09460 [Lysobacterales bacterium]